MAEITENLSDNLGEIVIAPEVLEVIAGVTVSKIDGVYALRNKRTLETVGKKAEGKGVYIKSDGGKVTVDLYLFLVAGVRVPEVAQSIQREVTEKVFALTEIEIFEVNVHIMGIVPKSIEKPDFDDLFREGFFDAN